VFVEFLNLIRYARTRSIDC